MFEVRVTPEFDTWLGGLLDATGKAKIVARLTRLQVSEHWGDCKPLGNGIIELRIDTGPGYRLYCKKIGTTIVLLLMGGAKKSQQRDILKAKEIARQWKA